MNQWNLEVQYFPTFLFNIERVHFKKELVSHFLCFVPEN